MVIFKEKLRQFFFRDEHEKALLLLLNNVGLGLKMQVNPHGILAGTKTVEGSKTWLNQDSREWVEHTSGPTKNVYQFK